MAKDLRIPDIWYDSQGNKYQTQERGERSYVIRSLDESPYKYRVMERVVEVRPRGLVEILRDNQKFERFCSMEAAENHFHLYEAGEVNLMNGIRPFVRRTPEGVDIARTRMTTED